MVIFFLIFLQEVAMFFVRAQYGKKIWYKYIFPKRLTLKSNPAIYRWLWWNFSWDKRVL